MTNRQQAGRLLNRFLAGGLRSRTAEELCDPYLIIRIKSVFFLLVIGAFTLGTFSIVNWQAGGSGLAVYEAIMAAAMVVLILFLRISGRLSFVTNVILLLLLPLLLYLLVDGGVANAGALWLFIFPAAALYLAGLRAGLAWVLAEACGIALVSTLQSQGSIQTAYPLAYLRQLAIALLVVTLVIYFHEKAAALARQLSLRRTHEQEVLNIQLDAGKRNIDEARVRYQALLESIGDGIIATDSQGKILLANQAALHLLKLDLADLLGKTIAVFRVENKAGDPIPYNDRILNKVLKTNKTMYTTANSEYYYVDSTGRRFPVASTQTPIVINGKNQGAVFVFRDATEEKRLDEAKTELVSLASHQLNGPLTAVSWYTEMLLSGDAGGLTKDQKEYLEEIYTGNTKMVELVNDFLNASRLELGTFVPKYQPVDVSETADDALAELQPEIRRKKLEIERNYAKLPKLILDKRMVQIILQNLLTNAVKYTDSGSVSIELDTAGSRRHQHLIITISDTGLGIPLSEQPKIFNKMYRAENAKVHEAEGTGLGLYIIKSIVSQLQGTITFTSNEGAGSSFHVELPIAAEASSLEAKQLHRRSQ